MVPGLPAAARSRRWNHHWASRCLRTPRDHNGSPGSHPSSDGSSAGPPRAGAHRTPTPATPRRRRPRTAHRQPATPPAGHLRTPCNPERRPSCTTSPDVWPGLLRAWLPGHPPRHAPPSAHRSRHWNRPDSSGSRRPRSRQRCLRTPWDPDGLSWVPTRPQTARLRGLPWPGPHRTPTPARRQPLNADPGTAHAQPARDHRATTCGSSEDALQPGTPPPAAPRPQTAGPWPGDGPRHRRSHPEAAGARPPRTTATPGCLGTPRDQNDPPSPTTSSDSWSAAGSGVGLGRRPRRSPPARPDGARRSDGRPAMPGDATTGGWDLAAAWGHQRASRRCLGTSCNPNGPPRLHHALR